jgi:nitrate reductase delta subunit
MVSDSVERRIVQLFAQLLEYPQPGLAEAAQECEVLLAPGNPEAATRLRQFRTFVEATPLSRVEELYTSTFDLDATCHPYVGYHLFGESYKRSVFLVGLKERYRSHRFAGPENELADHLAVLLRFLAVCEDADLARELVQDAMLPTLARMMDKKEEGEQPDRPARHRVYDQVLHALRLALQLFWLNDRRDTLSLPKEPTTEESTSVIELELRIAKSEIRNPQSTIGQGG